MKIKSPTFYLLLLITPFLYNCSGGNSPTSENPISGPDTLVQKGPTGTFLGMQQTETPLLLAPSLIATSLTEYNGTISPEGTELFYTAEIAGRGVILTTHLKEDQTWSKPLIAPFSGSYSDYDPLFSPDGQRLYFSSERPSEEGKKSGSTNICYVEREGSNWSSPQMIFLTGKGDYYSSLTNFGTIYFNVWNDGDIYKAVPDGSEYKVEVLPEAINGRSDVGDPFISPNEDYLIFRGYFKEGYGRGDLYISFREGDAWTTPENLGPEINSNGQEMCPYVTPDGKWFIFASDRLEEYYQTNASESLENVLVKSHSSDNGQQNIYYCRADFIKRLSDIHTTGKKDNNQGL